MGDAKWEDDCSRSTCKSGGNGGNNTWIFPSQLMTGENPSIIWLDRTGAEGSASGLGYEDGTVFSGDGNGSGKLDGLEKIDESIGDGKGGIRVEHKGCDDRSVGGL